MKNLRTLIAGLLLVVTLSYTLIAVSPALAGPPTPDIECDGYICDDSDDYCRIFEPATPAWYCTNLCWVGGTPTCYGQSGCILFCP